MTAPLLASLLLLQGNPANALYQQIFMFGSIFLIFWFLILRPQQKQRRQHEEMLKQIKKGDEVVTAGGIIGKVVHVQDDERVVITSENTRLLIERARIARVVTTSGATSSAPTAPSGRP
jgi:preprotein translocase subunit YajC